MPKPTRNSSSPPAMRRREADTERAQQRVADETKTQKDETGDYCRAQCDARLKVGTVAGSYRVEGCSRFDWIDHDQQRDERVE